MRRLRALRRYLGWVWHMPCPAPEDHQEPVTRHQIFHKTVNIRYFSKLQVLTRKPHKGCDCCNAGEPKLIQGVYALRHSSIRQFLN